MAEFEPGRWYHILQPDGKVWMETSDPDEVFEESARCGWPVQRLWQRTEYEWRAAEPTDTEPTGQEGLKP